VDLIKKFGYVSVGVNDLEEATEFYSRFVRLDLTERHDRTAFMTGGPEHHWLRLEEGGQVGVRRLAFELVDDAAFEVVRQRLRAYDIECEEGGDTAVEGVQRWLRFTDPGGTAIELYRGMKERGFAPDCDVELEQLLHAGWKTADFAATTRFYQDALGFRPSDWVEDNAGFFRVANKYHHAAAVVSSDRPAFDHLCIQVGSLDDLMRLRSNAQRSGIKLRSDLLRHAPSGSISIYMHDEARQYAVEFCIDHPTIESPDYSPRILELAPDTIDMWQKPLAEPRVHAVREGITAIV